MTTHEQAIEASQFINTVTRQRIRFYTNERGWMRVSHHVVRVSPHLNGICDTHSACTDEEIIKEAVRLGWEKQND